MGPNIVTPSLQMFNESGKSQAFIQNTRDTSALNAYDQRTSSRGGVFGVGQTFGERGSDSVYFTPSGTPMRELSHSPSKGRNLYNDIYQQQDLQAETSNCNTLPNKATKSGKPSSLLIKPPFIKTHGKSRSFSFHLIPSSWFGSATAGANAGVTNERGEVGNWDGQDEQVHRVLIEREACGSSDYLSTKECTEDFNSPYSDDSCQITLNHIAENVGQVNHCANYSERDELLPSSQQMVLDMTKTGNYEMVESLENEDRFSGTPVSSLTLASSSNDSPLSVLAVSTDSTTNNSHEHSCTRSHKIFATKKASRSQNDTSSSLSLNAARRVSTKDNILNAKDTSDCSKNPSDSITNIDSSETSNKLCNGILTHKRKSV